MPKPTYRPQERPEDILREKLLPILTTRYNGLPINLHTVYLTQHTIDPKIGAGVKWSWLLWVHDLPLRVTSWQSVIQCAKEPITMTFSKDEGGTPGHASVQTVKS